MGQTIRVSPEFLSADEAVALLRPQDSVGLGLGPANPHGLLAAMSRRTDWENLIVAGALVLGLFDVFQHPGVHYRSGFFGPAERWYVALGADVQLVPAGFRQFAPILARLCPRVMMVQASEADERGMVNLSLHHGATFDELVAAGRDPERLLIVETSPHFPRTSALPDYTNEISLSEIDVVVKGDAVPVELPNEEPRPEDLEIARFALEFIGDQATLQTGIGSIPSRVVGQLETRPGGSYGIHSEMFTDALWKLHLAGKVSNRHKGEFPGVSVTTFALGSQPMYEWLHDNPLVVFAPVSLVNDPAVIGNNESFVSVNGAIAVDLFGQIVADSVEGRQISGVGGHEDFVAGAELATDDVSLICLRSTVEVNGSTQSRILATLPTGSVVATPRHHTGVVITEYGAADLRGRTVRERAVALATIAHPSYREELMRYAEQIGR